MAGAERHFFESPGRCDHERHDSFSGVARQNLGTRRGADEGHKNIIDRETNNLADIITSKPQNDLENRACPNSAAPLSRAARRSDSSYPQPDTISMLTPTAEASATKSL